MKKRIFDLLLVVSGTMALSACSLLDGLSDLIPGGDNGNGNNNNNGQASDYPCPSCSESFNYQPDHEGPCQYEAETCKLCQRDIMLDYIEKYNSHGTYGDPIVLNSEQELISLFNYVHLNRCEKYFKLNYEINKYTTLNAYTSKVLEKATDASCGRYYGSSSDENKIGFVENTPEQFENNYLKKAGVDYEDLSLEEYENPIDEIFLGKGDRESSFDDFKIYDRKYELNVQTGDDLFYACTHGYKPKVVENSNADIILKEIKKILRENIKDSMTDFEKAFTMYCWLVKNVQYDHGAVKASDYGEYQGRNTELAAWGIEGTISEHQSICDSLSKTYAIFMGMENIKCIQNSGNSHAWNKIYLNLDGEFKWYVVDPTWGNASGSGGEASNHDEFLYDDATKEEENFKASNYLDVKANQDINQYKYIKYDGTNDLFIENDLEFRTYCQYIGSYVKSLHNSGKKVNIEFCLPTGSFAYSPSVTVMNGCFKQYFGWDISGGVSYSPSTFDGYQIISYKYEA